MMRFAAAPGVESEKNHRLGRLSSSGTSPANRTGFVQTSGDSSQASSHKLNDLVRTWAEDGDL
jgi:hypothetical protein